LYLQPPDDSAIFIFILVSNDQNSFVSLDRQDKLIQLVRNNGWIKMADPVLRVEKPGEGNMNLVVRIVTPSTSLIVKQSRPWVEKYPQISAPVRRIFVEAAFYRTLKRDAFYSRFVPGIIGFDGKNYLLALQDLGAGSDYTFLYKRESSLADEELGSLLAFISHLHNTPINGKRSFPLNLSLRKLNHTHIFVYPYQEENGFDLNNIQPGLQEAAMTYKTDKSLKRKLKELGGIYLSRGQRLLHGDYYPGSWLKTSGGIRIIDPEFAHQGRCEFDLGVMLAHFRMAGLDSRMADAWNNYEVPAHFDEILMTQFYGVEILRRVIGLAQLPLVMTLPQKQQLLSQAARCVSNPDIQFMFA
jgi:5-methylthioribose kinase